MLKYELMIADRCWCVRCRDDYSRIIARFWFETEKAASQAMDAAAGHTMDQDGLDADGLALTVLGEKVLIDRGLLAEFDPLFEEE
jgi:hypothetical protein